MKNIFASLFRCIKWLLCGIAIIALVVLACWILLPDETLNPDAQRIIEAKPIVPPEQNAYYALWGLKASPELDAFEVGRQIVAAQAMAIQTKGYWADFNENSYLGASLLKTPKMRSGPTLFCKRVAETPNCLASFREHRSEIETELRDLDSYVQRYRSLRNYPHFEEVMVLTAKMPFIAWAPVAHLSELMDAKIALDMAEPSRRELALNELQAEIVLWQKVGSSSDLLITRMMAASLLRKKYRLASELLSTYPEVALEQKDLLSKITRPLVDADTSVKRVFDGEFRFGAMMTQNLKSQIDVDPDGGSAWLDLPRGLNKFMFLVGFKTNATINLQYARLSAVGNFYSKSGPEIADSVDAFQKEPLTLNKFDPRTWMYNPVGKIEALVATPEYGIYAYRLHDLAGYSRLVELQRQLALNRTPPEKMAEFIAAADTNLSDPYTGKPMAFDPVAQTISFTPRGTRVESNLGEGSVSLKVVEGKMTAKP